jgi:hypothetical protein
VLRRSKRAQEGFHPLHRAVIDQGGFRAALGAEDVAALLASFAAHDETQRRPLPQPLVDVAVPVVRVLAVDLAPGAAIDLALDVRGATIKEKTTPRFDVPLTFEQQHRRVRKVSRKISTDTWLWAHARLRDKTTLELTISDTVRDDKITKTGASGKTKLKRKYRRTRRITSKLALPTARQIIDPGQASPLTSVTWKLGERHPTVTAKTQVDLDSPPPVPELQLVLLAMGEPFRWAPPLDLVKRPA